MINQNLTIIWRKVHKLIFQHSTESTENANEREWGRNKLNMIRTLENRWEAKASCRSVCRRWWRPSSPPGTRSARLPTSTRIWEPKFLRRCSRQRTQRVSSWFRFRELRPIRRRRCRRDVHVEGGAEDAGLLRNSDPRANPGCLWWTANRGKGNSGIV